jgi:hypothetical protein
MPFVKKRERQAFLRKNRTLATALATLFWEKAIKNLSRRALLHGGVKVYFVSHEKCLLVQKARLWSWRSFLFSLFDDTKVQYIVIGAMDRWASF